MTVAVIGGAGRMGRQVLGALRALGADPVGLSRRTGFDLSGGSVPGLAERLHGSAAVIDCSDAGRGPKAFRQAAERLRQASERAGVQRLVVVSIVGVDRPGLARLSYYQGKLTQERELAAGDLPLCVLRTTQWFEFADLVYVAASLGRLGRIGVAPRMVAQPVAGRSVARRLAEAAMSAGPALSMELAGPQRMSAAELIRRVNAARGISARVGGLPVPGIPGFVDGSLLPGADAEIDPVTIEEWAAGLSS